MNIASGLAPILDLIYPPRCPLCGEGLASQQGLCASCWAELAIPGEPWCQLCQRPFGAEHAGQILVCAPCMAAPPKHAGIAAATLYNDTSRRLVLSFKHGKRIALAPLMGRQMAARLGPMPSDALVVPVPLHRWRLWHRGFNQAALLARVIAKQCGTKLLVDGLQRRKPTPSLGGLGKKSRKRVLSGAIVVNPKARAVIKERHIVLVDDVLTSGATSSTCVSALKSAGAKSVRIACFARVLDEAL